MKIHRSVLCLMGNLLSDKGSYTINAETNLSNDAFCDDNDDVDTETQEFYRKTISTFDKFVLLMWKNSLLQWHHKIQTIAQILIPIIFTANLMLLRGIAEPEVELKNTTYNPFSVYGFPLREDIINNPNNSRNSIWPKEWKLVYSPKNPELELLLSKTAELMFLEGVLGVKNSSEVERVMIKRDYLAGVVFDHEEDITELPKKLSYTLRFPSELRTGFLNFDPMVFNWQTNLLYPLFSGGGPRGRTLDDGSVPFYFADGFIPIQNVIAHTFIKMKLTAMYAKQSPANRARVLLNEFIELLRMNQNKCKTFRELLNNRALKTVYRTVTEELFKRIGADYINKEPTLNIQLQRFPYPPYIHDVLLDGIEKALSLFIMLSFVYPVISTVRFIAVEKEKQLKEIMKIMGMPVWLHWTSWFVRTMILTLISICFMVALIKVPVFPPNISILTNSNWFIIWIFLFTYSISMTAYSFFASVLFERANTAVAVSGLMWFVTYIPFVIMTLSNVKTPLALQLLASLSPNVAMAYGFYIMVDFERSGDGVQWSNLMGSAKFNSELTVGMTICCMLLSSIALVLITLYIEKVFPGEYGVPEKWYFPLRKEFWFDSPDIENRTRCRLNSTNIVHDNFEPEPCDLKAGVKVRHLHKIYDNGKVGCNDLTFNMFYDQITVLLGHNGAGKSTTIKMLIGMIPPTSGTAIINGYDIRKDLQRARESLGICPQHDILFDELTVREHIEFYSRLKGLPEQVVQKEVVKYVRLLNLKSKINSPSKSLSGGMKRKLSFGIALCGDSKVVLCDEPTSGVDPSARRELWDLIQSEKKGRTVILTTHFMDEADVLGDRIAIMADGEMKCWGTPFFLKKRFGSGYHLICVKKVDCNTDAITNMLREHIPEVRILEEDNDKLSYALPYEHVDKFGKMFEQLERELDALKLHRFGVSPTELEEVFLKVGSDNKQFNKTLTHNGHIVRDTEIKDLESSQYQLLRGFSLRKNHWRAMYKKRYYSFINHWSVFLGQILIVVIFVLISVTCVRMAKGFFELPKLDMALDTYIGGVTMLQTPKFNNTQIDSILNEYRNGFKTDPENMLDEFSEDIQDHFLRLGNVVKIRSNTRYPIGLTAHENGTIIVWFNNQLHHTAPISLNLLHNAILKAKLGADHSIKVANWPIGFNAVSKTLLTMNGDDMGSQLAVNLSFAMAFIMAFYALIYIKERSSKAKLLQFISGVEASTFWLTSLLFDFLVHILTCLILLGTLYAFQEENWADIADLVPVFVVLIVFGLSTLAITFVFSFLFKHAPYGFGCLTIVFVFTGLGFATLIRIMLLPALDMPDTVETLKSYFLAFPHYALAYSLFNMNHFRIMDSAAQLQNERIHNPKVFSSKSIYDWDEPGIGRSLTYMLGTAIAFFFILWAIEYRILSRVAAFKNALFKKKLPSVLASDEIENDVKNEKNKVNSMNEYDLQTHSLVLQNLTKFYGKFLAVKELCVAVKSSECFGLLGINGAGKTTTFKMITGDIPISSGEVFVKGLSLKNDHSEVHKRIGYCPQFDALLEDLTGEQTLEIFGLLRGYRREDIIKMSTELANNLNFTKHIHKQIKDYSGGNKRKLSTAIAILGKPDVIYLDEPSSGMDPGAKRNLWNVISQVRNTGTSIVLTSHSMEECEAICTRLAIMVGGEFKCLGSAQHLKNQFSKGFLLTIKVRSEWTDVSLQNSDTDQVRISNFVHNHFLGAILKEKYEGLLTYYIPQSNEVKWSLMFDVMETAKREIGIEDYSLSQTTLEQVFLSFTKTFNVHTSSANET